MDNDEGQQPDQPPVSPSDAAADAAPSSRRKRRGTGSISTLEERLLATAKPPPKPISREDERPAAVVTPRFGRYERPDFERVEGMLAAFANRRLGPLLQQVGNGFFGAATAEEKQNEQLRTAFYSFFLYGYKDPKGIRVVDLFREAGLPLDGRLKAAYEACLQARLVLMAVEDVHPGKHRVRGRDMLLAEPVTVFERNLVQALKPGERFLSWQIPWGTSWKPIGVASHIEARKAVALDRGIETLCNNLRCVRRELPDRHAGNLWWLVHRVANMRV
jgi:hypothetical protein